MDLMLQPLNTILHGDCLDTLKQLEDNSIDAVCTDPPYGLSFMGKKWDYDVPSVEIWQECLRVLKPGGYLLAFAGTRTQHRMAVRIEDAGFEIRDMIAWVYGSGFPKSLNIGKAVDKLEGNEREDLGFREDFRKRARKNGVESKDYIMAGGWKSTEDTVGKLDRGTSEWEGWGTALKPALEPITVARKPLGEKTVAENCLKWGVGGINIDGCRVGTDGGTAKGTFPNEDSNGIYGNGLNRACEIKDIGMGRFPANLIHDGSDEVVELFPNESQRFFYCAKASKSERNKGCEELEEKKPSVFEFRPTLETDRENWTTPIDETPYGRGGVMKNNHPTVKPIALMEYLIKLVSRENTIVLDPFAGSGSTLVACKKLGRNYIGCELSEDYIKIAEARLNDTNTVTINSCQG